MRNNFWTGGDRQDGGADGGNVENGADLSGTNGNGGGTTREPSEPVTNLHAVKVDGSNVFGRLLDGIVMEIPTSTRRYGDAGNLSQPIINGLIIHRGGIIGTPFTVYARQNGKQTVLDFSVVGNRNKQGITPLSDEAKADWTEWKTAALLTAKAWFKSTGGVRSTKNTDVSADDLGINLND